METRLMTDISRITNLFSLLYDDEIVVEQNSEAADASKHNVVGEYRNSDGTITRKIFCDFDFANRAGAALTKFPINSVEEAINNREVPESFLDNLREVLNIGVNLFDNSGEHLVLANVFIAKEPSETAHKEIISFDIVIGKYGRGVLSLATAASE